MYTVKKIKEIVRSKPDTAIIYFWGHTPNPKKMTAACFSQWYDCYFEVEGTQYHTTEQYMMASKARLFGDEEVLREIMEVFQQPELLIELVEGYLDAVHELVDLDSVQLRGHCAFRQVC